MPPATVSAAVEVHVSMLSRGATVTLQQSPPLSTATIPPTTRNRSPHGSEGQAAGDILPQAAAYTAAPHWQVQLVCPPRHQHGWDRRAPCPDASYAARAALRRADIHAPLVQRISTYPGR